MKIVADFHIHSRYSRATSGDMCVEKLSEWAKRKGIHLLGTGDFTHPLWFLELRQHLESAGHGLYRYKDVHFILTAEVSTIFSRNGKVYKVHTLIFAPSFEAVEKINQKLSGFGNLQSDGRPIFGMEARDIVAIVREADKECFAVPAHIWTPHFSVFGSNSGFDTVQDCFRDMAQFIFALETGLSSDPAMNWRLSMLDQYCLISNSDSHSPSRIGREANVFSCGYDYHEIKNILMTKDTEKFLRTIEYFPEEGKYHWDGHRACNARLSPVETRKNKNRCPVCGKPVTVGVANRVESLSDRPEGFVPPRHIPFTHMIPLDQIIADIFDKGVDTKIVQGEYRNIVDRCGTELEILCEFSESQLKNAVHPKIAEAILRVRNNEVAINPGYDGEYGTITIPHVSRDDREKQLTLF
jgi:uncharacterized protein (TIGR00375 family)